MIDVDDTTHDDVALLDALTVEPSVVTVVAAVVPVETVVSAGAPDAVPSAISVPAHATAAKASPAAIHFNPRTSTVETPQLPGKYPSSRRVTQSQSFR